MTKQLFLAVVAVCLTASADADVIQSLTTQRHWIGYAPRNSDPTIGLDASQAQIRADLELLYDQGWRSLYTYSLDGNGRHMPRIAKEVGFDQVLAGVFYFDDAQLAREKAAAIDEQQHIDGFIVGNEGLVFGRYSKAELIDAVEFFENFGKPIGTTEVSGSYFADPSLLDVGDFTYVNIQPWFNQNLNPFDPIAMAATVGGEFRALQSRRPDNLLVIKEAWWPTAGHPAATEANQIAFFQALADITDLDGDPLLFSWGEAFDQTWKDEPSPFGTLGPDWGLNEENGDEKAIIEALRPLYASPYPGAIAAGDFNGDGEIDVLDYVEWIVNFDTSPIVPGIGADANGDGVVDLADYTVWRDAEGPIASAVPEPHSLAMAAGLLAALAARRRG
ncbi:MAG: PEP-CTERM sorting domain-containing protein [Planctomycetota bacterium]